MKTLLDYSETFFKYDLEICLIPQTFEKVITASERMYVSIVIAILVKQVMNE